MTSIVGLIGNLRERQVLQEVFRGALARSNSLDRDCKEFQRLNTLVADRGFAKSLTALDCY